MFAEWFETLTVVYGGGNPARSGLGRHTRSIGHLGKGQMVSVDRPR